MASKEFDDIKEELKWIQFREARTNPVKGIYGILIPTGLTVTIGILGTGLYYFVKRNSRKQQIYMRYRVLAQGVTIGILAVAVLQSKSASGNAKEG